MTDFIDRFGDQLVLASQTLAPTAPTGSTAAPPRRPAWRMRRSVAIAVVGAVVTGSALAATQPWQPILGRPSLNDTPGGTASSDVPGDQRALLGVLRRPQADSDRGPEAQRLLRNLGPEESGVRTASVRLLSSPAGARAALVSVERAGAAGGEAPRSDALCLLFDAGGSCGTLANLRAGQLFAIAGDRIYGIVPDGVASVTLAYPNGERLKTDVEDNFFAIAGAPVVQRSLPGAGAGTPPLTLGARPTIQWLDADGNVVGPPADK
jgi:hypothetical protein